MVRCLVCGCEWKARPTHLLKNHGCPSCGRRITGLKKRKSLDELQKAMNEDKIKLLTIHASKGLESPNVLMWGNFPVNEKPYLRNNDEIKVRYVRSN